MLELEGIKKHPIKTHTLLIDDLRNWCKDNQNIGFGPKELCNFIIKINDQYIFRYENGYCENDILVTKSNDLNNSFFVHH
jgi:hypothetical protein